MSNKPIRTLCLAAAVLLACGSNGRAAESVSDSPQRTLQQNAVDLNLGDAGGHSRILYNQSMSPQLLDTVLARESINGIGEALESARKDFDLLEREAQAGPDQTRIKIFRKIRQHYDSAGKNLDGLKTEFAKSSVNNGTMMSLSRSIFADLNDARKELAKLAKRPLKQPPAE